MFSVRVLLSCEVSQTKVEGSGLKRVRKKFMVKGLLGFVYRGLLS